MLLWRLSGARHAKAFDGGYGLLFDGRWNTVGHAVTYASTSPSLCMLEKLVHIEDPCLLPEMIMVAYEIPGRLGIDTIGLEELPVDWPRRETSTQQKGDDWHELGANPLLRVPSAIVPLPDSPDVNFLINHNHPATAEIKISRLEPFVFYPRLL
jgi:RES domain-containing protein